MKPIRIWGAALVFVLLPLSAGAAAPDLDAWLVQHPRIANAIIWTFPEVIPDLTLASVDPAGRTAMQAAVKKTWTGGRLSSPFSQKVATPPPSPPISASCPAVLDLPTPGKTLRWCQWPQPYRDKLEAHFVYFWNWMETSWALYRPYKDGGFSQKPPGFDERFGSTVDPQTGAEPGTLPFATQKTVEGHTYTLFDVAATTDLYLKITALQLVLEAAPYLDWSLSDYDDTDLGLLLTGGNLFEYIPVGGNPYGQWAVDKDGYKARTVALVASPLVVMKFLMREGILRDSRFDTVSRFLEWERFMTHLTGGLTDQVGGCNDEMYEIIWGFKGPAPIVSILHGTKLTCTDPPGGFDGTLSYGESTRKHYTHGCPTTGDVTQHTLRQINLVAENFRINVTHSQTRFVVEKIRLDQMLADLGPLLPFEPPLQDGGKSLAKEIVNPLLVGMSEAVSGRAPSSRKTAFPAGLPGRSTALVDAYLDHNDNPYGMAALTEIPIHEALLDETTFHRWFPEIPEGLSAEEEMAFREFHTQRVSFRLTQLKIARLPLHLFQYFCWKEDAGKPHGETELYKQYFEGDYTPAQLEQTGFWTRFDAKFVELGGCEGLPPMW